MSDGRRNTPRKRFKTITVTRTKIPKKGTKSREKFNKKFRKVMVEYQERKLKSSSGRLVRDRRQALAIAFSKASKAINAKSVRVKKRVPLRRRF